MGLSAHVRVTQRVHQRLLNTTAALDAAGIRYAVVGGNAVASWVRRVDPGAIRATRNVDLIIRRADYELVITALAPQSLTRYGPSADVFLADRGEPSVKYGVQLLWADERIRPSYTVLSPAVEESERDPEGFQVIALPALVRMKLTSFRPIDQVHLADMLSVGLIDAAVRASLPPQLAQRLAELERAGEANQ